jgi:hypothetical protein
MDDNNSKHFGGDTKTGGSQSRTAGVRKFISTFEAQSS